VANSTPGSDNYHAAKCPGTACPGDQDPEPGPGGADPAPAKEPTQVAG